MGFVEGGVAECAAITGQLVAVGIVGVIGGRGAVINAGDRMGAGIDPVTVIPHP